jgi:hypothetical protein
MIDFQDRFWLTNSVPVENYDGHLAPIVETDNYFDAIVPFRTLLGMGQN